MRIFSADEWQQLDEYLAYCDDDDELLMTSCSMLDSSFPCHGEPDIRTLGNEIVEARSDLGSDTSSNCNCDFSGSTLRDDDGKIGKPNEDTDHSNPACADTFVNAAIGADAQQTTRLT
eukprot:CAMPEP_0198112716 /NCGR_PEP_ID=MMETSP1442-20131203/4522_1 /TAXON_ID= /ORGANISM="Craspedostauros australis, Strain CCMP3328" /LENGTH=117 /DNA_ID=CAMNT_0043769589 /DNA_START=507 /DNA_END=856 /DNA_ORIENTATION=-